MALVTLNEIKDFYGLLGNTDNDDLIESLIVQVSKIFESYCRRTFDSAEYTEYFDGGVCRIVPSNYPITSISGVWDDRDWSWGASTEVTSTNYRISNNEMQILFNDNVSLLPDVENVKVIYTAGYTTIPDDLKLACIEEVVRRYKRRQEVDVTGKTLDDGSVAMLSGDMLPQTKSVLNLYIRRRIS